MPRYELNRLGSAEFENLFQALLKCVIGNGTITFGTGADGGQEATFEGSAPYPSETNQWSGSWVFQAKYHNTELLGTSKARKEFIADVDDELDKLTNKYSRKFDNYIVATNVPLSPTPNSGTLDAITKKIFPKYSASVKNLAVWGADEIDRYLDVYPDVKRSYLHLITPGELIATLLKRIETQDDGLAITLRAYLSYCFRREQNAQLDQAGDVSEQPVRLQQVFFELESSLPQFDDAAQASERSQSLRAATKFARRYLPRTRPGAVILPTTAFMLSDGAERVVLIGGPGEGKSTVGQYLAQLHRAVLIGKPEEIAQDGHYSLLLPRVPFRVILREFGQWLSRLSPDNDTEGSVEAFICEEVRRATSRTLQPEELHSVLRDNPSLLILDGLDEVTDAELRKRLLSEIDDFVDRAERVLHANMQVFATTRPTGYNNQFNSKHYLHLRLIGLGPAKVREYVRRWAIARNLEHTKADRLQSGVEECLSDHQVRLLTRTPLQVTILVLIISTGGTPPRQREALFDEYLEVIYKREQAKSRNILTSKKEMLIGLHKYVGYELHERATRPHETGAELDREEYARRVDIFLRKHDPYSPDEERRADIASITTEAGERLVLIVEPTAGRFGFELRSIQEFFAALHICDTARDTQERYRRFEALVRLPHWRNVVLFFAGRVGRNFPGEASNVVEVCRQVDREGLDMHLRRGAFLALLVANDQAFLPNRRMQRSVIEVAMQLLEVRHTPDRTMNIIDALASLPDEDVRDHVIPLLQERATLLAPERATSILKSLALLNPGGAEALELLRKIAVLTTCRVECFGAAVQIAVVQAPAIEIARNLACAMDPAELRSALDTNVSLHPRTVLTTVGNGAPNETLSKLIRAVGPRLMQSVPSPTVENLEIWNEYRTSPLSTSSIEALYDLLHALGVIRRIHIRSHRNSDADAETLEKLEAVQAILPRAAVDGDIDDLIARTLQGVEGVLAAPYWALHLLVGRVSAASLERFHEFYASYWNDPFVQSSMSGGFDGTAILDYVCAKWRADLDESWESINSVLLEFGGLNGFKRWRDLQANLEGIQYSLPPRERRKNFRSTTSMLEFEPVKEALSSVVNRFDRDLVDILLSGRLARSFAGHRTSETDELLESVTHSHVITNLKRNQIRELCARDNVDGRLSEARIQVLDYLVALRSDARAASLLLSVSGSAISTGLMSDEQIKQRLADISTLSDESLIQLGFMWPQSTTFYSTLVPIAAEELDTPARRGAAMLLVHSGIMRSRVMLNQAPMAYRFAGFAGFQTKLAVSNNSLIRAAGTATFFVRRSIGRNAEDSLRTLIRTCRSDVEEQLITTLCDYDMQLADRWKTWRNVIEPLLSEELFGELKPFLTERMSSLLESENQSLQSVEEELNLPLGRLDGTDGLPSIGASGMPATYGRR